MESSCSGHFICDCIKPFNIVSTLDERDHCQLMLSTLEVLDLQVSMSSNGTVSKIMLHLMLHENKILCKFILGTHSISVLYPAILEILFFLIVHSV